MAYLTYSKARKFVRKLGLKTHLEWRKYCKSGIKPHNIPANPTRHYGNEWKGLEDWLGTGRVANQNRKYRSFEQARDFIHQLNFPDSSEIKSLTFESCNNN